MMYNDLNEFLDKKDSKSIFIKYGNNIPFHYVDDKVILCTAANPLHSQHLEMSYTVTALNKSYSKGVFFEISMSNVDKTITNKEIRKRVNQFSPIGETVIVTWAGTFVEKSFLMPYSTFAIGTDTLIRINDIKYYYNSQVQRKKCIQRIKDNGCSFLVFPRFPEKSGKNLPIIDELRDICIYVEDYFPDYIPSDVSSTKIRNNK